jgi:PleD family two-component response regulator
VPKDGDEILPTIAIADRRLYLAKQRGRARVVAEGGE